MAQNYTRQSIFADGDTITAALFNDEYNQLFNTFKYSSTDSAATGHRHDGTAGEGGNIYRIGDLDFLNKIEADSSNNRWGVFVEVGGSAVEQVRIQDGAVVPVTNNDVDLGSASFQFKDLYIDGTANIDSLVADTADINGGTIDGVTIGGSSAGAITGTTGQFNTSLNVDGTVTADGASLDGAVVVNESGAVVDFRVESDNNTHMLFVDGGNNRIGFNQSSPAKDFHYKFTGATDVSALLLESSGSDKYGVYLLSGFTTEMGRVGALSQADGDLDGASIAFMDFGRELEFRTGEGASNAKVTYISKTGLLTHEKAAIFNESGGDNDFRVESDSNTHMLFVDASANKVGIGTSSPNATLQVQGPVDTATISISSTPAARINNGGAISNWIGANGYNYGYIQSIQDDGTNNLKPLALQPLGGSVGIGTTSPSSTFQVGVPLTATAGIRVSGSSLNVDAGYQSAGVNGTAAAPCLILGGDPDTGFFHPASDTLAISTSGNERVRLDASGNLGIGTTNPASKLSIAAGDILLDNTRSIIFKDSGGVARGILQYFSDNSTYLDAPNGSTVFRNGAGNTEKMRIDASGNALIGTNAVTGSLSNTARVTGGIFSTNNGTTSVPNATWTTLATIPTGDGIYLVTAYLPTSGDPANYNAVSIVTTSLTGTNLVDIKNAPTVDLRMSGSSFQVNHGQGTTQPINWSILRLA